MLKKLIKKQITQLYITLPAPDEETFQKVCRPLIKDGWKRIMESLKLLQEFKCRKTIRMTLAKDINMIKPEKYAGIIKDVDAEFFELKAYMFVGYSRQRLNIKNMPTHDDIIDFSKKIIKNTNLKLIDQKPISRVALLMRKDTNNRIMKF
jgi:tRNA wybutosine-synthesizing protein 1